MAQRLSGILPGKSNVASISISDFETALPSLACRAAIELDNLLLGRLSEFQAVPLLIDNLNDIKSGLSPFVDPNTALIINRAISNVSMLKNTPTTTIELLEFADDIQRRLKETIKDAKRSRKDVEELKTLRSFCVELSKSSAASCDFLDDMEQSHPFRR